MTVLFPVSTWPTVLDERGPQQDPSILLTGMATVGGIAVRLVAVRIDPCQRRSADYRPEVPEGRYRENGLNELIETALDDLDAVAADFGELLGESSAGLVHIGGYPYMIWLISAALGA